MQDFTNIPVGTKCFVETRHGWNITYVTRHTKTLVVTQRKNEEEVKWRILDGTYSVSQWESNNLEVFTEKHQAIVDKTLLKRKIKKVLAILEGNVSSITEEDLNMLIKIGEKYE